MQLHSLRALSLRPGVVKDDATYDVENRYIDSDKVRFFRKRPQRMGGWEEFTSGTFSGICRGLFSWGSNLGAQRLAIGTHSHLYAHTGGGLYDVTPTTTTLRIFSPFTTTNGSTTVTVSHFGHGLQTGDTATFSGATAVGGITVSGIYTVTVTSSSEYEITHGTAATASDGPGGGAPNVEYSRWQVGNQTGLGGGGYGVGGFGTGAYGAAPQSGFYQPRTWALSNWGEELLASPQYGALYRWDVNTSTTAAVVSSAPPICLYSFVTAERHCVLLGTTQIAAQGRAFDPLLVRWSSREDLTDWEPTATNTARDYKVPNGSRLVAGVPAGAENLIWTDKALYSMRYLNYPYWYGFQERGSDCGLIGPNAFVVKDNVVFWMSPTGEFYVYDGGAPRPLPDVPVRDFVFLNITPAQEHMIYAFLNPEFHEVGWLYPEDPSQEVNRYAIYNYRDDAWAVGTFDRTAWIGRGVFTAPVAADTGGKLYFHERGNSANGGALSAHIETGPIDIGDGSQTFRIDRYVPDFQIDSGAVKTRFEAYDFTRAAASHTVGPFTTNATTEFHDMRLAGRTLRMRVSSDGTNDAWRMGRQRIGARTGGKR